LARWLCIIAFQIVLKVVQQAGRVFADVATVKTCTPEKALPDCKHEVGMMDTVLVYPNTIQETIMKWTKPAYVDIRYGFEITMYIANR